MSSLSLLLNSTIKTSLIVLAALAVTTLLRRRSAALRHRVLMAALVCAAAMPALEPIVPAWDVHPATESVAVLGTLSQQLPAPFPPVRSATGRPDVWLPRIWVAGVGVSLLMLLLGLARLMWLASGSMLLTGGRWSELADDLSRKYRLARVVSLLQSQHPTLLVTWGLLNQRSSCRRLRREGEHACDDAVLNLGVEGTEYAGQLVDLARTFSTCRRAWLPAYHVPAMARPSSLERRVRAMLNARLNRTPVTASACVVIVAAFLGIAVPIVGFGAATQGGPATFSGSLLDTLGRILADKQMVLANTGTGAKHAIRSDQAGHFMFTGLAAGDYSLDAQVPGFATGYRVTLRVGQNLRRDVTLQLGSIEETVSVTSRQPGSPLTPPPVADIPPFFADSGRCGESRTGGCIEEPTKVRDVVPSYPQSRLDSDATVLLEGRIGTDGFVKGLRALAPADAEFASAALEAVSQWQFIPTRLDGVTVETVIKVTVLFKVQ